MTKEISCIIWDCDGCLIDSEILACQVSASMLSELGYEISTHDYIDRFAGKGIKQTIQMIEQETGRPFLNQFSFDRQVRERTALFREKLAPIKGIKDVLKQIKLPMCIASGSEIDRLTLTLEITGLYDQFAGRIYSSSQVVRGKPFPDIFLHAATQMHVDPDNCLVIEDSPSGIKAAHAAGMAVFGFVGASHATLAWKEKLIATGVDVIFEDMHTLPSLLAKHSNYEASQPASL